MLVARILGTFMLEIFISNREKNALYLYATMSACNIN